MTNKRYSSAAKAKAAKLYRKGWTVARITRQEGMPSTEKTVRRWLQEQGVELRGNPPVFPRDKILKELNAGKTRTAICERYGCSPKYISRLVQAQEES